MGSTDVCSAPLSLAGDTAVSFTSPPAWQRQPQQGFSSCPLPGVGISRLLSCLHVPLPLPSHFNHKTKNTKKKKVVIRDHAAACCTHQREGSANYFLVQTVSVTELKRALINVYSLPPHVQAVAYKLQDEATAHALLSSYFHSTALIPLFPCKIHHFLVEHAQSPGSGAGASSQQHCHLQAPHEQILNTQVPEHPAKLGTSADGRCRYSIFTGNLLPTPNMCCVKSKITFELPAMSYLKLRSPALGPPRPWDLTQLTALLGGKRRTWQLQGEPHKKASTDSMQGRNQKKFFCIILFQCW